MSFNLKSSKLRKQVLGILVITLLVVVITIISINTNNTAQGNNKSLLALGSVDTNGILDANGVFLSGSYAYIVTNNNAGANPEFYIVDISAPQSPRIVGFYDVNVSVNKVYVSGDYAYLATKKDTEDIIVLNISNKLQPTKITGMNIPNNSEALTVAGVGSSLYVGFANSYANREFYILSTANPIAPQVISSYEVGGAVNDIVSSGNYVYLATSNISKELTVLNLATPNNPTQANLFDLSVNGGANALSVSGEKVYLVTNNNAAQSDFFVVNSPIGGTSTLISSLDLDTSNTGIALIGTTALVSTQTSAKSIIKIDAINPASPLQVSAYDGGARANDVIAGGIYVYVALTNNSQEFQIIDSQENVEPTPSPQNNKPNIILIMTDDQRWDTLQYMPNVTNLLVNQGVIFKNSFVTTPLCCPSRAGFLTGEYAHNTGVRDNIPPNGGAPVFNDTSTIAKLLHDAGYTTGLIGKYLNKYDLISSHIPPGWDDWRAITNSDDMPPFYNYGLNENGTIVNYGSSSADYSTDVLKTKAVNFINANVSKPFFMMYTPFAPHSPSTPAPRHAGMFSRILPFRPVSWKEDDITDKPAFWTSQKGYWSSSTEVMIDTSRQAQLESLQAVDEAVRDIVAVVDQAGLKNQTMIIFTSDNGLAMGEHWGSFHKRCPYEECIRVPMVVRYPALVTTPRTDNSFILNIDFAPTVAELAGVGVLPSVNGRSFLGLLKNTENNWRTDFLTEGWRTPLYNQPPTFASVRSGQWKFIHSEDMYQSPFDELYNMVTDPYELQNVASSTPDVVSQLKARLVQLQAE